MSAKAQTISVEKETNATKAIGLYESPQMTAKDLDLDSITLPPFGVLVAKLKQ